MFERPAGEIDELYRSLFHPAAPLGGTYGERLARMSEWEKFSALVAVRAAVDAVALYSLYPEDETQYAPDELGVELHISPGEAFSVFEDALAMTGHLPAIGDSLAAGTISTRHSKVILQVLRKALFTRTAAERETEQYQHLLAKMARLAEKACLYAETHTPTETRKRLKGWVLAKDTRSAELRHEVAVSERNVIHQVMDDGMATLSIYGPVHETYRMYQGLNKTAHYNSQTAPNGDERRIGQHRYDAFAEVMFDALTPQQTAGDEFLYPETRLIATGPEPVYVPGTAIEDARQLYFSPPNWWSLDDTEIETSYNDAFDLDLGEDPGPMDEGCFEAIPDRRGSSMRGSSVRGSSVRGRFCATGVSPYQVNVTCDAETFLGIANNPMWLDGVIPISASQGRKMFDQADFLRLLLERDTGDLIDRSPYVYRPNRATADYVRARDPICRRPGCLKPAANCELDHQEEFNQRNPELGGSTLRQNLGALCKRDHQLKTNHGFDILTDEAGATWWVTPHGQRHLVEPYDNRPTKGLQLDTGSDLRGLLENQLSVELFRHHLAAAR